MKSTFTFSRPDGGVTVTFEPETRFPGYNFMVIIHADYNGQIMARDWMVEHYTEPSEKAAAFFVSKHLETSTLRSKYPHRDSTSGTDQIVGYSDVYGDAICVDCDEARGGNISDHETVLLLRHAFEDLGYHCMFCGRMFPDGYGFTERE